MQLEKQKRGLTLKIRQSIEQSAMHVLSELRNPEVPHALCPVDQSACCHPRVSDMLPPQGERFAELRTLTAEEKERELSQVSWAESVVKSA